MITPHSRRKFLTDVGRGMLAASVGFEAAHELGFGFALADESERKLDFGQLESLVCLMQETPVNQLLPALVGKLRSGTEIRQLVAAAALANARTFGGEDYVGFHTMMALAPSYHMSQELPESSRALPVFKVLYRNSNRIGECGGRKNEVLHPVSNPETSGKNPTAEDIRQAIRNKDLKGAEAMFARSCCLSPEEALNQILVSVQDTTEVHRVVMPYRAWDLLGLIGMEQAHTLLRQSVHYCVKSESYAQSNGPYSPRALLPKLLESHKLLDRSPGQRNADDAWVEQLSNTIFKSSPEQAAETTAAALAEGFAPADIGQAISLAANQLILRDMGRTPRDEVAGKPLGSVHGDSIGVHASDSANAWRNLARVGNPRNCFASLILGAYQVALDRSARGGDFLNWNPLPLTQHLQSVKSKDQDSLLRDLDESIRGNLQARASALVQSYADSNLPARPLFDLLLRYAISEDGALHAEKFYRTVSEEFAAARPKFRWRYMVALARVTASEYGRPAPGMAEARSLLKV